MLSPPSYPGSDLTVEQDLGPQAGFHSYVVSYRSDEFKIRAAATTLKEAMKKATEAGFTIEGALEGAPY